MRIEVIRCDMCKKEHDTQYVLPREWARVIQYDGYGLEKEYHFCSLDCLFNWTADAMMEKKEH